MYLINYKILFLLLHLNNNSVKIDSNRIINQETVQCNPVLSISIDLEEGYHKEENTYEEGTIVTYTYSDSSYVLIFCGQMQRFPILSRGKYIVTSEKESEGYKSRFGINSVNNKYWREINYESGIAIIYDNISVSDLNKFDLLLNYLKIND